LHHPVGDRRYDQTASYVVVVWLQQFSQFSNGADSSDVPLIGQYVNESYALGNEKFHEVSP
jgi:hypothetical protein